MYEISSYPRRFADDERGDHSNVTPAPAFGGAGGGSGSDKAQRLAERLHDEANGINEAFTKYAFQALSICGVALGAIIEFMFFWPLVPPGQHDKIGAKAAAADQIGQYISHGQPLLGLAALPILAFALSVCRMGTYNLNDANRLFGFELHLARVRNIPTNKSPRWNERYRDIDWEEAMRAWRVIQSTLFRTICTRPSWPSRHKYKPEFKPSRRTNPVWYSQRTLFGPDSKATWYAGKYLDTIQRLLLFVALLAAILLWIVPLFASFDGVALIFYLISFHHLSASPAAYIFAILLLSVGIFALAFVVDRRNEARRATAIWSVTSIFFLGLAAYTLLSGPLSQQQTLAGTAWQLKDLFTPDPTPSDSQGRLFAILSLLPAIIGTIFLWISARNERARRALLTDGILSIHSCAVIWQATVVGHYSAIDRARHWGMDSRELSRIAGQLGKSEKRALRAGDRTFDEILNAKGYRPSQGPWRDGAGLSGYIFWLGQEAESLARWPMDVPSWVGLGEVGLRELRTRNDNAG